AALDRNGHAAQRVHLFGAHDVGLPEFAGFNQWHSQFSVVPSSEYRVQSSEFRVRSSEFRVRSSPKFHYVQYRSHVPTGTPDSGPWTLDPGLWTLDPGPWTPNPGPRT